MGRFDIPSIIFHRCVKGQQTLLFINHQREKDIYANVNPGFKNAKRNVELGGYHGSIRDWLLEEYLTEFHHDLLIRAGLVTRGPHIVGNFKLCH